MRPQTPTGRPYPSAAQAGPEGLGCNRRCVGGRISSCALKPPRGVPIPPRPRQDRRDSGVTAAVWGGGGGSPCASETPTGRLYPSVAQAGPEGLGCNRRCVGGRTSSCAPKPPRGVPIPPRPRQDRKDSGVTAAVWGGGLHRAPPNPHGASLSLRGPGRTGGTRV